MKGISPMIAVILLIAFTVGVGGLLGIWLPSLTITQTGRTESLATNSTTCAAVYLLVDRVTSTAVIYTNPTSEAVTTITVTTSDGTSVTGSTSLGVGATVSTAWVRGTNTSVTLYGKCQNSIIVTGICKTGQACWT